MIRTIVSIFITLALIAGVALFEMYYVHTSFEQFHLMLESLQHKVEEKTATYEDGLSLRVFWEDKKKVMHVFLPHTMLQEIDYQLDEAIGFIYQKDFQGALPKLEVVIGLSDNIPHAYTFGIENIF